MKLVSWNVNGLRAVMKKGFEDVLESFNADIFCVQETKMQKEQATFDFPLYQEYWNSAEKKGYSGTAIFSKVEPISVQYDLGLDVHNDEGRVISMELEDFFLVNVYSPNSGEALKRLEYRLDWQKAFETHVQNLPKPAVICGDLNVAHREIDLKNPATNRQHAGFTDQEREMMTRLLDSGYIDSFRYYHPNEVKYSWWSYRFAARERNAGWRLDYFLVDQRLQDRMRDAQICNDIFGSDHCPVSLTIQ